MLHGFGYLYKFAMFYFVFFFQKAENNRFLNRFCNITFLFLLKIGSVGPPFTNKLTWFCLKK